MLPHCFSAKAATAQTTSGPASLPTGGCDQIRPGERVGSERLAMVKPRP